LDGDPKNVDAFINSSRYKDENVPSRTKIRNSANELAKLLEETNEIEEALVEDEKVLTQIERKLIEDEEEETEEEDVEGEDEDEDSMIVAVAAGVGGFFILMTLLLAVCCINKMRSVRSESARDTKNRRPVEANPQEQTFERLDFTHTSIGTLKRQKKLGELHHRQQQQQHHHHHSVTVVNNGATSIVVNAPETGSLAPGDMTSSEIAPSSMGTLRTYLEKSHHTVKNSCLAGNDSDFRNTSSDIDSIESSNPPKPSSKIITVINEKKKYGGYQELATRDRSNYSTSSTASSCGGDHVTMGSKVIKGHHVIMEEDVKGGGAPPAYETITRSRDSVIDL